MKGGEARGRGTSGSRFPLESCYHDDGSVVRGTHSDEVLGRPSCLKVDVAAIAWSVETLVQTRYPIARVARESRELHVG